jgi:hypothetical protein
LGPNDKNMNVNYKQRLVKHNPQIRENMIECQKNENKQCDYYSDKETVEQEN